MDDADRAGQDGGVQVPLVELERDNPGRDVTAGGTCRWHGAVCTVDYVVRDARDPGRSFASLRVIGR